MGWANGSYMAESIYRRIRNYLPQKDHKKVALIIFSAFDSEDADDWNSHSWLCKDAGVLQEEEE